MAITSAVLFSGGQVPTSRTTMGKSPPGVITVITQAVFTNTDTASHTFSVNIVRNSGTSSDGNQLIHEQTIPAGAAYVSAELRNQVLGPNDSVVCVASAANVITLSGISCFQISS